MKIEISKRKLESYKRAEKVCQEFRYQIAMANREDWSRVLAYLSRWMDVTGAKVKYKRPKTKVKTMQEILKDTKIET